MQGIIAVEPTLTLLCDALEEAGFEVVDLTDSDLNMVDAIIVSGADSNLMNIQTTLTDVPIINASGKTPDDILAELNRL